MGVTVVSIWFLLARLEFLRVENAPEVSQVPTNTRKTKSGATKRQSGGGLFPSRWLRIFKWQGSVDNPDVEAANPPLIGGDAPQQPGYRDSFRYNLGVPRSKIINKPHAENDTGLHVSGDAAAQNAPVDKSGVRDMSFSPDGKLLAVCGGETSSKIWLMGVSPRYSSTDR